MTKKKSTRVFGRKSLPFVEAALREAGIAQTVDQIIAHIQLSGVSMDLVTKSQTPYNTISRDLALDLLENGERSRFVRVGYGRFMLRALVAANGDTKADATDTSVWTTDAGGHA